MAISRPFGILDRSPYLTATNKWVLSLYFLCLTVCPSVRGLQAVEYGDDNLNEFEELRAFFFG